MSTHSEPHNLMAAKTLEVVQFSRINIFNNLFCNAIGKENEKKILVAGE